MEANLGDPDTFSDVLGLISEYEGVMNRHESLAANLGAKLTGARLLKAMEAAFEGPIITSPPQSAYSANPIGWVDIMQFAKTNPGEFTLTTTPDRERVCQFMLRGIQVEITEDDWRLIMSGALDGFRIGNAQPLEEDESAEIATLEILEGRLQVLIKKADEVARRARQLNYQLSGRKAAINTRRQPQQGKGGSFQPVNQQRPAGPGGYDLHADLLQQFLSQPHTPVVHSRASSTAAVTHAPLSLPTLGSSSKTPLPRAPSQISRPSFGAPAEAGGVMSADDADTVYRTLITARIEKLARGDTIYPPCDRCRRLKTSCIKHLTACQGCTKKHARCGWKSVSEDELAWLRREAGTSSGSTVEPGHQEGDSDDPGDGRSALHDESQGEDPTAPSVATTGGSRPSSRGDARPRFGEFEMGIRGPATASTAETAMEVDDSPERRRPSVTGPARVNSWMVGGHSLLHVASAASARADSRDEPSPASTPRH